jgi:ubiquitin carboxyl-terminal hydrolase 4/11/15
MLEVFTQEIKIDTSVITLGQCLQIFQTPEILEAHNQWFCSTCSALVKGQQKLDLWRLPNVLVIQLKRYVVEDAQSRKIESFVDFPDQMDFGEFVRGPSRTEKNTFKLFGVCNHFGSTLNAGHYVAHIEMDDRGKTTWYEFNDSNVTESGDRVKSEKAYVLFYRRV